MSTQDSKNQSEKGGKTSTTAQLEPQADQSEANDETTQSNSVDEQPSSSSSPPPTCANCQKPQQAPEKPLKPCSKCQSVSYCDRDCTKAHFKVHKKVCAKLAQEYFSSANLKMESSSRTVKEGRRGGLQKWQFDT